MIRLLIAVVLVTSFNVMAQKLLLNEFEDGKPAKATEVNYNFDALNNQIVSNDDEFEQFRANTEIVLPPSDCSTNQIIKWNGSAWVCTSDPFAGLNCNVGDQLRLGSSGWGCRTEPITASLAEKNWNGFGEELIPIRSFFESVNNVSAEVSSCDASACDISVPWVTDHSSCVVQITGGAVSRTAPDISTSISAIKINTSSWNEQAPVYINISCPP